MASAVINRSFMLLVTLGLVACSNDSPGKAPTDSDAVRQRAAEAQTARSRTGAEVQERALNRTIRTVYLCTDAERLTVDFDNPRRMATVRNSDGIAVDLHQQAAASGIWYTASGYDLKGKGINATWKAPDLPATDCRAVE